MRVAAGLNLKPVTFLSAIWGSTRSLLNQDLDNYAPAHVAQRVAAGANLDASEVSHMTLAAYAEILLLNHNVGGRNAWILPTTIKSNDRRRRGLQFCPVCLASDRQPYFRRRWRLALITACTEHGVLLRDSCLACEEAIHPHRAPSLTECYRCGESLCKPSVTVTCHDHLAWILEQERTLARGWAMLAGEPIRAHIYFAIVRQIAALLVNGPRAPAFRAVVAGNFGGDDTPFQKITPRQPIEYLDITERHRLFQMVRNLVRSWPSNFVMACQEAGIYRSHAIKDMRNPPYIYEQVMRGYLDSTPYYPSEREVAAAATWLRRTKGHASYSDLCLLCGESRALVYQHMDYQRIPARPSKWRTEVRSQLSEAGLDGLLNSPP